MVFFRRGALAPDQIALLVLAIVGFALAALFIFGVLKNENLNERELCGLSILERATVPGIVENLIPLNCFTEKVCITPKKNIFKKIGSSGKSACKQFAGETNVRDVAVIVDNNPEHQKESANIIQREVANSMFDCWKMTGAGKLDLWTSAGTDLPSKLLEEAAGSIDLKVSEIEPRCLVCSRVSISEEFYKENKLIDDAILKKIDYNLFMSREKVPGSSLTYIQAFTDESVGTGYSAIPKGDNTDISNLANKPIGSSQIAIVFTQIKVPNVESTDQFWNTFRSGAIMGGLAAISSPGKKAALLLPGPGWVKALFQIVSIGAVATTLAYDSGITTIENQALSAATCGNFESKISGGEQRGCSLVKLMNWDVEGINDLCIGGIEGNP